MSDKDTLSEILYKKDFDGLNNDQKEGMSGLFQLAEAGANPAVEDLKKISMAVGFDDTGTVIKPKALQRDPYAAYSYINPLVVDKLHGINRVMLKQLSVRDPVASAIIKEFALRISSFGVKSKNRYDIGSKIIPVDGLITKGNSEKIDAVVKQVETWFFNVGELRKRPVEYRITLEEFLSTVTRELLTYGLAAVEKVRDKEGKLAYLWPADSSTIYPVRPDVTLAEINANLHSWVDPKGTYKPELHGKYKYLQIINGRAFKGFTEKEMDLIYIGRQAWWENQGLTTGPLELCLPLINAHLQAINFNNNFLIHGHSFQSIIHIKNGSPQLVSEFRQRWNSMVAQAHINGFRTPIVGGDFEIELIQLSSGPKEMELVEFQCDLIRKMCAIFGIDPAAIGFSHLARSQQSNALSEGSQAWKVEYSEKRGFKPVLNLLSNWINASIIPEILPELDQLVHYKFVGIDREDKAVELQRFAQELETHKSINDVREEVGLEPLPDVGSQMVLNPIAVNINTQYMKSNEIRAEYLGTDPADMNFAYPVADPQFIQHQELLRQGSTPLPENPEEAAQQIEEQGAAQKENELEHKDNQMEIEDKYKDEPPKKVEKMQKADIMPMPRMEAENIRDELINVKREIEESFKQHSDLALAKLINGLTDLNKNEHECDDNCNHE